ncbi:MAG: RING finger domain-containing protein [Candidatus Babeliales bacterium]
MKVINKKKLIFAALLINLFNLSHLYADNWFTNICGWVVNSIKEEIKESKLKKNIKKDIDYLLATTSQSRDLQKKLAEKTDKMATVIALQLKEKKHFSTGEFEQYKKELVYASTLQLVVDEVKKQAQKDIERIRENPPINPILVKKLSSKEVMQATANLIIKEAQAAIKNKEYGALKDFIGESLEKKVQFKIEKQFGIHDSQAASINYQATSYNPKPSAPPSAGSSYEIYEIYPNLQDLSRNKNFHARRERGQLYRESECCICMESFMKLGKRVTLYCGHSICPTCLFGMMYITEKKNCPLCRDTIKTDEFSVSHLRPHVNVQQLKENLPTFHNKINQFFRN